MKVSGELDFEFLTHRVKELEGDIPSTGSLIFVPQALSSGIQEEDVEVSYYSSGVDSRMVVHRETSVRALHRPTGLLARCDAHRRANENRDEAIQFLAALLAGRISGEQSLLG